MTKTIRFIEQTRYLSLDREIDDVLTVSVADAQQLVDNHHAEFVVDDEAKKPGGK